MKCSGKGCHSGSCGKTLAILVLLGASTLLGVIAWNRATGKKFTLFGYVLSDKRKTGKPLVTSENGKEVIASTDDFQETLKILERGEPGMQFIATLPEKEQVDIYNRIANDYIVTNYLIKKYIESNGIDKTEEFKKDYENYINIMMNTFYSGFFQKKINESLVITDEQAKLFYENARFEVPEFMNPPFATEVPGIEARAVRLEEGKTAADYKQRLKDNKEVMNLGRLNRASRGITPRIMDTLEAMKDGETRSVELENGISFVLYRIKEHTGKWASYDDVADQVKQIMRVKMLEKRGQEVLLELKEKEKVMIDETIIIQMVQEKRAIQEQLNKALLQEVEEADKEVANATESSEVKVA